MLNLTTDCGPWSFADLRTHGVELHDREWEHASSTCCRRRSPVHRGFGPDVDATLRDKAVKLLVLVVADSSNFTRALTLANVAAFSQVREVSADFLVVASNCDRWRGVSMAATKTLGITFRCITVQPAASPSVATEAPAAHKAKCKHRNNAASTCSASTFRPKLPLQLYGIDMLRSLSLDSKAGFQPQVRRRGGDARPRKTAARASRILTSSPPAAALATVPVTATLAGTVTSAAQLMLIASGAAVAGVRAPATHTATRPLPRPPSPPPPPPPPPPPAPPRLLEGYDAVWMPDADIAFSTDGIAAFLLRWACAFEAGPPLVAQPALHGDLGRTGRSQQFWHLNYGREWQPEGRLAQIGAVGFHAPYIEQQAPLLDAGFFAWFAEAIGRPLAAMQEKHGTDLGTDQLWCRAAAHYAIQRQGREGAGERLRRASCAVLPVPFRHRGLQRRRPGAFWRGSATVREAAAERWPFFWLDTKLLRMFRLSSEHVEETKRLRHDRCMVRLASSRRIGPAC